MDLELVRRKANPLVRPVRNRMTLDEAMAILADETWLADTADGYGQDNGGDTSDE